MASVAVMMPNCFSKKGETEMMKKLVHAALILLPAALVLLLVFLLRGGTDILGGLLIFFPLIALLMGLLCRDFLRELLPAMLLASAALITPVVLFFNMGTCAEYAAVYCGISMLVFFVKKKTKAKRA